MIKERIQKELKSRKWSIYRLGRETGVSQQVLGNYLLRNTAIRADHLEKIFQTLAIKI